MCFKYWTYDFVCNGLNSNTENYTNAIHVIFSLTQIGRSGIFGGEIWVPDREIFSRQKYSISVSY